MSSSPFEIFRNNLKPLMVLLTILALFSFVVLPVLDTYLRRGGGMNSDPVAATFDGVELTRGRVARTTQNHASVVRFLRELADRTIAMGGMPQSPGFQYDEQNGQIQALGIDASPGEEATINTLRFYSEAKKAGFELDDTAVKNWIARFTDGTMGDDEVIALLMKSSGNQLGQQHLFEQLRMHLLADLYQRGSLVGLTNGQIPVVPPLGQWQNFLKTSRKANVDAYGVLVSEYLDETNENPSKSEIQEVYDEGKNRISYPNDLSPAPKFRRPDSAQLQWVAADLNQFIEAEKAKLSEDQLRAEYERRLAGGDFQLPAGAVSEAVTELEKSVEEAAEKAADEPAAETTESEPAAEDSSMNPAADTAVRLVLFQEEAAADDVKKVAEAAKEVAESAKETAKPETSEKLKEMKPEADKAVAKKEEAEPADEKPATEKAAEKKAAEKKAADEEVSKEEPASESPSEMKEEAKPTEEPAAAEEAAADKVEPATTDKPASDEPAMQQPAEKDSGDGLDLGDEPEPTKPQTFEEVRDQIATEMATQPARQALDQAVTEATKRMRRYFSERAVHESNVSVGVQTAEDAPELLDLKSMADELGLIFGETDELANRVSAGEIAPGSSFGLGQNFNRRGPPFAAMMFGAQLQDGSMIPAQAVYAVLRTVDIEAARTYISWKTEDVASYIPELDEVRDEVVQVIRMREARTLAKAAADELAQAVSGDGKSLADLVPEAKKENLISGVGPFSWLDQVGFMQTTIASVPELDAVGDDFMRAVFGTEVGEQAVASNDPQTVFYVIQPTEFQPSLDDLKEQFRQPQPRFMAQLLGNEDARNLVRGFYQSVDERTGFEFNMANDE